MKASDRQALRDWDAYRASLVKAAYVDIDEDPVTRRKRVERLEQNFEAWAKYYFPHYCQSEFAAFHKRFAKKVIENDRLYITRAWARAHAKSVMAGLMLPLYLKFTKRMKNMILVSYNESNAIDLLTPIQIELESNPRFINDYGEQRALGTWEEGNFKTTDGCSFRAIGSGQNPRGTRNEAARPDLILVDDIDDDELCRNSKRLDDAWDWMMGALFGCFDITGGKRFIVVGNIIAKDTLVKRAAKVSDDFEQINILDNNGQPSWKERFSLDDCQYMISKMAYRLAQREYFNNPITEGKIFKKAWMVFDTIPAIRNIRYKVAYLDPGFKKTKTSDTKSWVLVGLHQGKYYIIKVFCGQASVNEMIEWGYELDAYLKRANTVAKLSMEEVFLQSLLYDDFADVAKEKGYSLPLTGDTRKKPDKDSRIEATSGHFERGNVIFNIEEEKNPHMQELVEQYLNFEPGVRTKKDGPDAVEGAIFQLNSSVTQNYDIGLVERYHNDKYKL